ncbi:cysteine--tRNA ligase [Bosea sp. (in: a-proteobacteria)]|uniref:cysteine--tRNA ligase n=1 Tax=Bosea sp. (in: a-proteobacteria) TaxID=1871050 RepID=UPI00120EC6E5|nr:cysteine--tRNA ligase [Bosea sp. (in: a-proteobacteria)]TAJ26891.1 MAG: cysteine--tRNA ligase [Bosea sp. (in: a-proteobacteria)]
MSPTLRLYNTLTRTKEDFVPIDPQNVRMYVCGPTVYDYAHIGNARPVIVFDVLYRLLRHLYGESHVTYARNLTDVDDKINARAARDYPGLPLNEAIAKVTEGTTAQFHADIDALGCLRPDAEPRATDHIEEMKAIIERLIARGVAYVAEEHVLFHVPAVAHLAKAPKYGTLARRSLDEMLAGARVDVAPYKRDPMDFVLWKPSRDGIDPGWPSPAGIATPGRPGWHIECSAMSMAKLLAPFGGGLSCDDPAKNVFDIHGGGIDLVFPHHENEIAQSCCAFGGTDGASRMANYWMHNGFLQVEGEKMSKSLGNFVTINELLATEKFGGQKWHGRVLRLAMLMTHYRQPIDWTVDRLVEARSNLVEWNELCFEAPALTGNVEEVVEPLLDDLNTAAAVAAFHALAKAVRIGSGQQKALAASRLRSALALVGLYHHGLSVELLRQDVRDRELDAKVQPLIAARLDARRAKNFAESDRIRDELAAMGIALKDGKDPQTGEPTTTWEVKR